MRTFVLADCHESYFLQNGDGCMVTQARNSREALEKFAAKLRENHPGLVVDFERKEIAITFYDELELKEVEEI